jgi:hypothetical protein
MKSKKELIKVLNSKEEVTFVEKKTWRTGYNEFRKSQKLDLLMYIFLSYAEEKSGIVHIGKITNIDIDDITKETRYSFIMIRSLNNPQMLSNLTLVSSNKPLSNDYIRPYSVVKLPLDIDKWN